MQIASLPTNSSLQNTHRYQCALKSETINNLRHFKITLDINFHWNQRTLQFCRFCRRPFWKWRPFECNFHHYQSIPHFNITLDIYFHWNQRTLKLSRFCRRPFSKWPPFARDFFCQNIQPTLLNIFAKSGGNPFGCFRYRWGHWYLHMFTVSMATVAILKIPRPVCTSWYGDPPSCEV